MCQDDNQSSFAIKSGQFIEYLSDHLLKDSVLWNQPASQSDCYVGRQIIENNARLYCEVKYQNLPPGTKETQLNHIVSVYTQTC
jgi:hypothetical protein